MAPALSARRDGAVLVLGGGGSVGLYAAALEGPAAKLVVTCA
jgi:hypothetical protein